MSDITSEAPAPRAQRTSVAETMQARAAALFQQQLAKPRSTRKPPTVDLNAHWPSTKALGVLNVFAASNATQLKTAEIAAFLRRYWLPVPDGYVEAGVEFLVTKGVAFLSQNRTVLIKRRGDGTLIEARRIDNDSDLEFY